MSSLSTHVLDTTRGCPAAELPVLLEVQETSGQWKELHRAQTNTDGRIPSLLPAGRNLEAGIYRVTFNTKHYFQQAQVQGFYPYVSVVFEKTEQDTKHFHIPLLLSPYGYSTYRGS